MLCGVGYCYDESYFKVNKKISELIDKENYPYIAIPRDKAFAKFNLTQSKYSISDAFNLEMANKKGFPQKEGLYGVGGYSKQKKLYTIYYICIALTNKMVDAKELEQEFIKKYGKPYDTSGGPQYFLKHKGRYTGFTFRVRYCRDNPKLCKNIYSLEYAISDWTPDFAPIPENKEMKKETNRLKKVF
jgi:hypothetical protein